MALRQDPYGNAFCPRCNSQLESYTGFGGLLAAMFLTDIASWVLTALFVGLGLLWTPAYIIAACIALGGMLLALSKQKQTAFVCRNCGHEFTADGVEP
jgi:hypothetical protein